MAAVCQPTEVRSVAALNQSVASDPPAPDGTRGRLYGDVPHTRPSPIFGLCGELDCRLPWEEGGRGNVTTAVDVVCVDVAD